MTVNRAVVAPMPSANVRRAVIVIAGAFLKARIENFTSRGIISASFVLRLIGRGGQRIGD
jgi:hypothetical protein